jgi:hypothetical protein
MKIVVTYNASLEDLDSINLFKNRSNTTFVNNILSTEATTLSSNINEFSLNANNEYRMELKNVSNHSSREPYFVMNILLEDFRDKIIEISHHHKYTGKDCEEASRWSFFSSLLFTISTMSTVGYGHVAPLTWEGRVITICYALIGIPIFMVCLANLSRTLKRLFELLYVKLEAINPVRKYLSDCKSRRKEKRRAERKRKRDEKLRKRLNEAVHSKF